MQQVVDLQKDEAFRRLDVQLLSISPDPLAAWRDEGGALGVTEPMLSDVANEVWDRYGTADWTVDTDEPGHTFFLIDEGGSIAWVRDYGAPENGGGMYVEPSEIVDQVQQALTS